MSPSISRIGRLGGFLEPIFVASGLQHPPKLPLQHLPHADTPAVGNRLSDFIGEQLLIEVVREPISDGTSLPACLRLFEERGDQDCLKLLGYFFKFLLCRPRRA